MTPTTRIGILAAPRSKSGCQRQSLYHGSSGASSQALGRIMGVANSGHDVSEVVDASAEQASRLTFSYGGMVDNQHWQERA